MENQTTQLNPNLIVTLEDKKRAVNAVEAAHNAAPRRPIYAICAELGIPVHKYYGWTKQIAAEAVKLRTVALPERGPGGKFLPKQTVKQRMAIIVTDDAAISEILKILGGEQGT